MLPTQNYVDWPKTKSTIALTKIVWHTPAPTPAFRQHISWLQLRCNSAKIYICGENDHGYVPCPILIHACLITGFVPRVAWRVPLVEQELLTLLEDTSSPPGFSGVRITRSLVLCVMLCRSLFVLLSLFIWPLCCLSLDLGILVSDYPFGIFKPFLGTMEMDFSFLIWNFWLNLVHTWIIYLRIWTP